jgi:hypothetical protein
MRRLPPDYVQTYSLPSIPIPGAGWKPYRDEWHVLQLDPEAPIASRLNDAAISLKVVDAPVTITSEPNARFLK